MPRAKHRQQPRQTAINTDGGGLFKSGIRLVPLYQAVLLELFVLLIIAPREGSQLVLFDDALYLYEFSPTPCRRSMVLVRTKHPSFLAATASTGDSKKIHTWPPLPERDRSR